MGTNLQSHSAQYLQPTKGTMGITSIRDIELVLSALNLRLKSPKVGIKKKSTTYTMNCEILNMTGHFVPTLFHCLTYRMCAGSGVKKMTCVSCF